MVATKLNNNSGCVMRHGNAAIRSQKRRACLQHCRCLVPSYRVARTAQFKTENMSVVEEHPRRFNPSQRFVGCCSIGLVGEEGQIEDRDQSPRQSWKGGISLGLPGYLQGQPAQPALLKELYLQDPRGSLKNAHLMPIPRGL